MSGVIKTSVVFANLQTIFTNIERAGIQISLYIFYVMFALQTMIDL